jgi:hypothetical protein
LWYLIFYASYYQVRFLTEECCSFVFTELEPENAVELFRQATSQNHTEISEACIYRICRCAGEAFATDAFLKLSASDLCLLVQKNELEISESDLFERLVFWYKKAQEVDEQEKKRVFEHVRYPLISEEELSTLVGPTKLAPSQLFLAALEYHVCFFLLSWVREFSLSFISY